MFAGQTSNDRLELTVYLYGSCIGEVAYIEIDFGSTSFFAGSAAHALPTVNNSDVVGLDFTLYGAGCDG